MKGYIGEDHREWKLLAYSPIFWAVLACAGSIFNKNDLAIFTWAGRGLALWAIWLGFNAIKMMNSYGVSRVTNFAWVSANACAGTGLMLIGMTTGAVSCLLIALMGLYAYSGKVESTTQRSGDPPSVDAES